MYILVTVIIALNSKMSGTTVRRKQQLFVAIKLPFFLVRTSLAGSGTSKPYLTEATLIHQFGIAMHLQGARGSLHTNLPREPTKAV